MPNRWPVPQIVYLKMWDLLVAIVCIRGLRDHKTSPALSQHAHNVTSHFERQRTRIQRRSATERCIDYDFLL